MAVSLEKATSPPSLPTASDHTINSEEGPASFFCRQCQSAYKQPKILKCLHSFCSQCIQKLIEKVSDNSDTVTCPLCACVIIVPAGGVKDMTSNSFLQRISNEYVKEIKHNLASRSLRDGSSGRNEPDGIHHELEQIVFTNLTDEQKSKTSRVISSRSSSSSSGAGGNRNDRVKTDTQPSSEMDVNDTIENMNRLQAKSMGLQGEALRVTYAIDHVNNHKEEWLQRREDLKRAIQRRSAQFQSLVKKMERNLISQIEDKGVEDTFHDSLDRGKTELRKNLKQVLHEVSVIKNVKEMANYDEIKELSSSLLGPSTGVGEVVLDNIKYQLDLPTKSIEEMVRVGFGNLVTSHEQKTVYAAELKDYATMSMAEITNVEEKSHSMALKTGGILSTISGDSRIKTSGYRSASVVGRQVLRRASDVGKTDAVLEEFQNARESLRNRRQEILRQSHSFRDSSPWRVGGGGSGVAVAAAPTRRVSRPTARRGRVQVQSLDRSSNVRDDINKISKIKTDHHDAFKGDTSDFVTSSVEVYNMATGGLTDSYKLEDTSMPSPIIEENSPSLDAVLKTNNALKTKDASVSSPVSNRRQRTLSSSSTEQASSATVGHLSASSSASSSRRVSFDMSPSMSPTSESFPFELFGKNIENSRQLRKAITGAADKKAKIEFLRENWQRRKEILIQNRGFVSSDESSSTSKPDTSIVSTLVSGNATTPENGTTKYENSTHTEIALASRGIGSPPLRNKFTSVRKTQINEKRYLSSPDSSRSPSVSGESPKITRKSEIPPSILAQELKNIEAPKTMQVEISQILANQTPDSNVREVKGQEAGKGEEEEEEKTVVETETISIPITTELLQDMKSPLKEITIPSTTQLSAITTSKTNAGHQISSNKPDDEKERETFIEETITVPFPNKSHKSSVHSLYSPKTEHPEQTPFSFNTKRAELVSSKPVSSSGDFTSETKTKTLFSRSSPSTNMTKSNFNTSIGIPSESTNTLGDRTDAKINSATSSSDRVPSFYKRISHDKDTTKTASSSLPAESDTTRSRLETTTNTTTTAMTLSATISNRMTSLLSPHPSTTFAQTTTTTTSSSSYSRRYVPRTETIDVAALFTNFYKTPSSTVSSTECDAKKKEPDDNKENVSGVMTKLGASKTPPRTETTGSHLLNNKTNTNSTPIKTDFPTKTEFKSDLSSSATKSEINSSPTQPRYGSSFLRNYYTSSTQSKYAPQNSVLTDNKRATEREVLMHQTQTENATLRHSVSRTINRQENEATEPSAVTTTSAHQTDSLNTMSTSSQTTITTTRKFTTSSLYSKYYSNPNALYSKPTEISTTNTATDITKRQPIDNKQYPANTASASQDQKVQETFTQAESARRVYEPPTSASLDQIQRRHTADISKTIPHGVKISELYSKAKPNPDDKPATSTSTGSIDVSKISSQSRTPSIKESLAESETENVKTRIKPKTHSLYQPYPYFPTDQSTSSNSNANKLSQADISNSQLPRQQTLPAKLESTSTRSWDAKQIQTHKHDEEDQQTNGKMTSKDGQKPSMFSSYHSEVRHELSNVSSPSESQLMEDNDSFTQSVQVEDSTGAVASSSGSRSLKEIARKKRERWRRLTVY